LLYYQGKQEAFSKEFPVTPSQHKAIQVMLKRDTDWLAEANLMDYSLIMGVMKLSPNRGEISSLLPPGLDGEEQQPYLCKDERGYTYAYYFGIIDFLQALLLYMDIITI